MYVKENLLFRQKHYRPLRKKETLKDLHHLVDLKFNYFIAMDEDDEEDIDIGKNDHLLEFKIACVDGGPSVFFLKCPSCLGLC